MIITIADELKTINRLQEVNPQNPFLQIPFADFFKPELFHIIGIVFLYDWGWIKPLDSPSVFIELSDGIQDKIATEFLNTCIHLNKGNACFARDSLRQTSLTPEQFTYWSQNSNFVYLELLHALKKLNLQKIQHGDAPNPFLHGARLETLSMYNIAITHSLASISIHDLELIVKLMELHQKENSTKNYSLFSTNMFYQNDFKFYREQIKDPTLKQAITAQSIKFFKLTPVVNTEAILQFLLIYGVTAVPQFTPTVDDLMHVLEAFKPSDALIYSLGHTGQLISLDPEVFTMECARADACLNHIEEMLNYLIKKSPAASTDLYIEWYTLQKEIWTEFKQILINEHDISRGAKELQEIFKRNPTPTPTPEAEEEEEEEEEEYGRRMTFS
jgi:hypothetical protein